MKKFSLLLLLTFFLFGAAFSQDDVSGNQTQRREMPPPPDNTTTKKNNGSNFKDRVFFGGSIGLQFGSYTFIDVSPLMGYRFSPKLVGGVGITYRYVNYDVFISSYGNYTIEDHQYGGRVFGRYFFVPQLFGHVEFESLNITTTYRLIPDGNGGLNEEKGRSWVNSAFVGGGYFQGTGKAGVFLMVLYNLIDCSEFYCPYPNRWLIRVGVTAGF